MVETGFRDILAAKVAESLQGEPPTGTERHVRLPPTLTGKATAVVGMRRAGKTTLLHQIRRDRWRRGARRETLPYVSFEDERLLGLEARHLQHLLEDYYRHQPSARGKEVVTWCFDEIQVVPGWEAFVRRVLDSEKADIWLSGSSAALLSREVASAMRGRSWTVVLHPFSFEEFLRHHGRELPGNKKAPPPPKLRSALEGAFLEYLTVGGFPEAQQLDADQRRELLRSYVDVAMLRDVVERHHVSNVTGLRWLVRHLLGNAAGSFSVEKFHASLKSQGLAISRDTLHQLLAHLEDCFLVRTVWVDAASERRRMANPRKSFPVDPALIPIFDRTGRANVGHALETAVLLELERRGAEVAYVRTPEGHEVDFLARYAGREELIQVCADASGADTAARELRALAEAGKQYPRATKRLLALSDDVLPRERPRDVLAQPAWAFCLER